MNPLGRYWQGVCSDIEALRRAFVLGPGVVDPADTVFGIDPETFAPPKYADYIATSNGFYAAATLRANLLSSLPLKIHRLRPNGDKDEVTSGQLWTLLHKVNPFWTFRRLIRMTELGLCIWGTGYWMVERGRNGRGVPQEIWWARPDRVRVVPHPTEYISGFLLQPDHGGPEIPFSRDEVIWLPHPNPIEQFSGLAPLAAARLAADVASAAMKSNRNIFTNGMQMAGMIGPPDGQNLTEPQAVELEEAFARRFTGVDRAHRVAVMRYQTRFQQVQMTPKDAEFIEAMKWSLEDICRALGVPLDMLGGQRTYANLEASERIMWANTIKSEARFLADEITEQLLPMFTGRDRADVAEFDLSGVDVLQESQDAAWARASDQIATGALTINEWRAEQGKLAPVAWGDVAWLPINLVPVTDGAGRVPAVTAGEETVDPASDDASAEERAALRALADAFGVTLALPERTARRAIEYGSAEHERIMRQFDRRTEPHERKIATTTADLMRRQRRAVLDRLTSAERGVRSAAEAAERPFDRPRWIRQFRESIRPVFLGLVEDVGQAAVDDLALGIAFDVSDPNVIRFLERKSQNYARHINETTYQQVKATLAEGIEAGEGIDALSDRVQATMGGRIRDAEMIARTESTAASAGGTQLSWAQSGVVRGKTWLSALDERVRPSHRSAHGQTVALDEDFTVGSGRGQGPGQINVTDENIRCRCTIIAVLDTEEIPERVATGNGHRSKAALATLATTVGGAQ